MLIAEKKKRNCSYSGYEVGRIDSSKASLEGVILHVVDLALQVLQLLLLQLQLLLQALHPGPLVEQESCKRAAHTTVCEFRRFRSNYTS